MAAGPRRRLQPVLAAARTRREIGLAGHSYGAAGVSYIGQWDPRVKAIVAWDNLGGPGPECGLGARPAGGSPSRRSASPAARPTRPTARPSRSPSPRSACRPTTACRRRRTPRCRIRAPSPPESLDVHRRPASTPARSSSAAARTWTSASSPTRRSARRCAAPDEIAWYTTAWFDKYLKGDPTRRQAPAHPAAGATTRSRPPIDPNHDGNVFSFYYCSRLDIHLSGGGLFDCEDMRDGLPGDGVSDGYRASTRIWRSTQP